ncbi:MAG: hypothetical protein HC905_25210 [Bacteroidales bacterium]|nr:hypothetical protein [Bacteroidales bacterium]
MGYLDFAQKASYVARIGSGSACRSLYEGFVVWGQHKDIPDSSDIFAIPVNESVHQVFRTMQDSILIVSSEKKKVSSSEGHALMEIMPIPLRVINRQTCACNSFYKP